MAFLCRRGASGFGETGLLQGRRSATWKALKNLHSAKLRTSEGVAPFGDHCVFYYMDLLHRWMDGSIDTSTTPRQRPLNYLHDIAAPDSDDVVVTWVVMSKLTVAMIAVDDACCKRRANKRSTCHWCR